MSTIKANTIAPYSTEKITTSSGLVVQGDIVASENIRTPIKRQTILQGTCSATTGLPTYLAAGAGLDVTMTASVAEPVIPTWANGFDYRNSKMDLMSVIESNQSFSALTPYANTFLYIENDGADSLTYSHSVYQPVYDTVFKGSNAGAILANFEGADEATTYTDEMNNVWTLANGTKLDNAQKKFNATTSLYFAGSNDYAQCVAPDMSGNWTIEFWCRPTDATNGSWQALLMTEAIYRIALYIKSTGKLELSLSSNGSSWNLLSSVEGNTALSDATWAHIAVVYDGANFKTYLNGTVESNLTVASASSISQPQGLRLGVSYDGTSYDFTGFMEGFRFSPYARYTGNFTAPIAAFTPDEVHYFNLNKMAMYKGDPSSWTKTYRVFCGEALCDDDGVVSVVNYALQGKYTSGRFTISASTTYSKSHNLGTHNYNVILKAAEYANGPLYDANIFYYFSGAFYGQGITYLKRNITKLGVSSAPYIRSSGLSVLTAVEAEIDVIRGF